MGNITDSVRRGFTKRTNPFTHGEVPEWWSMATWAGLGAIVVVLAVGAVLDHGGRGGAPAPGPHPYAVQTAGVLGGTLAPTDPGTGSAQPPSTGFADRQPAQVGLTGGAGVTTVPAGALNAAQAGLLAQATGNWSGVPLTAGSKAPTTAATPGMKLTGPVTVLDPAVTGTGTYLFSAPAGRPDGTAPAVRLQVSVEATASGFAVITG